MGIFRNLLDIASGPLGAPCGLFGVPSGQFGMPCSLSGVRRVPFGVPCNPFGVPQILFGVVRGDISPGYASWVGWWTTPNRKQTTPNGKRATPNSGWSVRKRGPSHAGWNFPRCRSSLCGPELPARVGVSHTGRNFPRGLELRALAELPALTRFPAQRGGFPGAAHAGRSFLHGWGLPATLRTSRSGLRAWRTGPPGWFAPDGPPARPARRPARHPARRGCCRPPGTRGWGSRGS